MKKLLTIITLSALVGTSAGNLKPMFAEKIVNTSFKSNQLNKEISNRSKNDNPFINKVNNLAGIIFNSPNGDIYLGALDGLYKSTNNGINFKKISDLRQINNLAFSSSGSVYIASDNGLYKSTDGTTFTKISDLGNYIHTVNIASNGDIYVGKNDNYSSKIYKSTDGITFTKISDLAFNTCKTMLIKPNGDIYVGGTGYESKGGLYKSTDNGKTFKDIAVNVNDVEKIVVLNKNIMYVGTRNGLYKSTDGTTFTKISELGNDWVFAIAIAKNNLYVGYKKGLYVLTDNSNTFNKVSDLSTYSIFFSKNCVFFTNYSGDTNNGLCKIDLIDNLLTLNQPNYIGDKYDGFVYKNEQKLDFKEQYLKSAMLDGNSITVPSTDVNIPVGEHTLVLTLKDEYKKYLDLFSGDVTTGQVTYKLWVKASVDKSKISYETNQDTDLLSGLVSDLGNTNGCDIIQTKAKTGTHNATLKTLFNSKMFDEQKSFYVQGTVDVTTNDFTETGTHQFLDLTKTEINVDGIYKMHLVDVVGNVYDCYYELGQSHWKLKGTFSDDELNKLSTKLNVTVNLTDPTQKQEANGWLQKYQSVADSTFNSTVLSKGKGFNIIENDLLNGYKEFLEPVTYVNPQTRYAINQNKLDNVVIKIAEQKLKDGLSVLPQNLNVNTSNVVNKSTLDNYSAWIKNYQDFINKNKDKWINDIEKIASRGFATTEQEQQIKDQVSQFLNNDNIKNYLKNVVWEDNKLLKSTSNDYRQYIELDKLKTDTINWVNQNLSAINTAYENAIKNAESGLNLHGYTISEILNGKSKPQIKSEIGNFADGQSYHDWLQSQANIKFRGWQLKIGLPIGLISLVVAVVVGCFIYRRTNPKYHGYWRGKKEAKLRKSNFKKNDNEKDNKSD